jgi:hypothetical protein
MPTLPVPPTALDLLPLPALRVPPTALDLLVMLSPEQPLLFAPEIEGVK